jgi:ferredoxin-NADP reductase
VLEQAPQAESVFIADGTGIAAIRPMLQRALNSDPQFPIQLLYAARKEEDLLYREDIEKWGKGSPIFTWNYLVSDPAENWAGLQGSLLEQVEHRYVQQDENRTRNFYICGIGQLVLQLRDLLRKASYERRAVKYEKW